MDDVVVVNVVVVDVVCRRLSRRNRRRPRPSARRQAELNRLFIALVEFVLDLFLCRR